MKKRMLALAAVVAACGIMAVGCGSKPKETEAPTTTEAAAETEAATTEAAAETEAATTEAAEEETTEAATTEAAAE